MMDPVEMPEGVVDDNYIRRDNDSGNAKGQQKRRGNVHPNVLNKKKMKDEHLGNNVDVTV